MLLKGFFCVLFFTEAIASFGFLGRIKNRIHSLKNKLSKLVNSDGDNHIFLDNVDPEYPKANATIRKVYEEQWNEYYDCLKNRLEDAGVEKTTYPAILLALEGTSVTLKCKLCVSPAESHISTFIEWLHNSTSNSSITRAPIETSEYILLTSDDGDLHLSNIQLSEAGFYWCQLKDMASAPYYLHVANEETEPTRPVRPETSTRSENYPLPPENLDKYGLRVFSLWTPWSYCSTCDKVGQRIRYGYCTISLTENAANVYSSDKDDTNEKKKHKSPEELKNLALSVLPIFRNRLPCRSPQTPKDIREIDEIRERKTEIMSGLCKIKCHKEVIFQVRDEAGNVLESANNSAGFYSLAQGIPESGPSVQRTTMYRGHGKPAKLRCPGNLKTDVPVIWQIGTKVFVPSTKGEDSERISLDSRQQILIKKLRFADSNIYSCWQRGELAGTIRLQVSSATELQIDHRVFMIGAIVIVSVMLMVFFRAFRGRKRFTIH